MQIKSLKVFCDVISPPSFSQAARGNRNSQSGVSQASRQLERRLELKLIDRSKHPFVLTPVGWTYSKGCLNIVRRCSELDRAVYTIHERVAGNLFWQPSIQLAYTI